jgi:putative transposase
MAVCGLERLAICTVIVKPDTVIAWHRKGVSVVFGPGRCIADSRDDRRSARKTRKLIRQMSRENPLWGAPRIHGELLELGIDIGETSVGKYMPRRRQAPSQTWRTFLENHVKTMVSVDFFTVVMSENPIALKT